MGLKKKAIVITPATGSPELADCINSVRQQTYPETHHLIVVDGAKFSSSVDSVFKKLGIIGTGNKFFRCDIPFNTGGGGYYGHRIIASFGHLVPDYDYVLFLDQDNWYDPNHVESLIETIEKFNVDWSYSLRKICDKNGNYLVDDNCESLGWWPAWVDKDTYLIDTSSYCFKVPFFKLYCGHWDYGWGADRRFFHLIKDVLKHVKFDTSRLHTLNYRLGGNEGSVNKEFFENGNKVMMEKYKGEFPWKKRYL